MPKHLCRAWLKNCRPSPARRKSADLKKYFTETREPEAGAPLIAGAHWSLGQVYEKEGRKAEARAELETAVRLKPDFEPAKKDLKRLK